MLSIVPGTALAQESVWTDLAPARGPYAGGANDMTHDQTHRVPVQGPSGRAFHSMAYDIESDRVILFGGETGPFEVNDDTWAYDFDTNSWMVMNPATSPAGRHSHALAYDAQSDRVILFGGYGGASEDLLNDTWAYDLNTNTWILKSPPAGPSRRAGHIMTYDSDSDQIILFGGLSFPRFYDETWAYDFDTDTWTNLSPSTKPFGRTCSVMEYDAESNRVILFGAETSDALYDDTWAYDYNTNAWTDMKPTPRPSVQVYQGSAYDVGSDRVILFGGTGGSETWAYDFNGNTWTNMNPVIHPSGRWGHAMAYDEGSGRVVLFGGVLGRDETWGYDSASNAWTPMHVSPDAPQTLTAQAGDGQVTLNWNAPSFEGSSQVSAYRIYRAKTPGGSAAFSQLAEVDSLTFVDVNVTNEISYVYGVAAVNGEREGSYALVFTRPVDLDPPALVITTPAEGETVTDTTVTVTGTASDNGTVDRVEISMDETTWVEASGTTSWTGELTLAEGPNTIYARAFDAVGREGDTSVSVMVELPAPPPPPPPALPPPPDFLLVYITLGLLAAAVTAVVTIYLTRRRRGMRKGEEGK